MPNLQESASLRGASRHARMDESHEMMRLATEANKRCRPSISTVQVRRYCKNNWERIASLLLSISKYSTVL